MPSPGDLAPPPPPSTDSIAPTLAGSSPLGPTPMELRFDDGSFAARYQLGEPIGEGGMGEVRLCHDQRIGREVALKVVRAGSGSQSDLAQRFVREARVQGQLEHPAIVPVYDMGVDAEGRPYFTMKRVRGATLAHVIARLSQREPAALQQYTRRKLLTAFASVCLAIDFAHARGVLHRDLKPGNVMLGDFGEVYVLDWGLAKIAGTVDPEGETVPGVTDPTTRYARTQAGEIIGTIGYMAPEQVRGEHERLDARTDVYALGAILFELLTLAPLHPAEDARAILDGTLAGADARASVRFPERDVPPELEAICIRATAVDPAARFASARELSQAIEGFLDGDRDLALRHQLAARHAATARELADGALTSDDHDTRARALREVSRALALDADNASARRELVRLMTSPPRALPPDAANALLETDIKARRVARLVAGIGCLSYFAYMPFGLLRGIQNHTLYFIGCAAWLLAAGAAFLGMTKGWLQREGWPLMIFFTAAIASLNFDMGPYILLPSVVMVMIWIFIMSNSLGRRWLAVAAGSLTMVVPAALAFFHVIPPFYRYEGGVMTVSSLEFHITPSTGPYLLVIHLGLLLTTAFVSMRMRDALTAAERNVHATSWQLRQLLPNDAQAAVDARRDEPAASC